MIHPMSNESFDTSSSRIATLRSSSFVKNFGWLCCITGGGQSRQRRRSASSISENI